MTKLFNPIKKTVKQKLSNWFDKIKVLLITKTLFKLITYFEKENQSIFKQKNKVVNAIICLTNERNS